MEEEFFSQLFNNPEPENFIPLTEEENNDIIEEQIPPVTRGNLDNLLINGKITETISFGGHEFIMRTLTVGEELAISAICSGYEGTLAQGRALATATVAAALESVDGLPLVQSMGPDPSVAIRQKFNFIKNRWYWNIIAHLYQEYMKLLEKQLEAFETLQVK